MTQSLANTVLGLDLGSNSIGWALLETDPASPTSPPRKILAMGARCFDAGMDGSLDAGKEESRGVKRRDKRHLRRQHDRSARRIDFIYLLLQHAGLLPPLPGVEGIVAKGVSLWRDRTGQAILKRAQLRNRVLAEVDAALADEIQSVYKDSPLFPGVDLPQRLPYALRAAALDFELSPYAVGRALFQLARRRGYLSNRKSQKETDDKELGKVEGGIRELAEQMREQNARTLAELYLAIPGDQRIRGNWTARKMFSDEFDLIWKRQAAFRPDLFTGELGKRLHRAIFRQRPLKSAAKFVGDCAWEKDRKRAPRALLSAQRFRLLQQVNNTTLLTPGALEARRLSPEERNALLDALEFKGDLTFKKALKLLKLKDAKFNYESGGEKKFIGNRTSAKLCAIFGEERWRNMTGAERDAVVEDWFRTERDDVLERHALGMWKLSAEKAKEFARLTLEDKYAALSRQALAKLLPEMETGLTYMEACMKAYGDVREKEVKDTLPPVDSVLPNLRNPTVARGLTELRKIVNAIVRRYGKPAAIRIELARELRKSKKARTAAWTRNREQEKRREEAGKTLTDELGIANPSRADKEKILLMKECGGICPYTGRSISVASLFDGTFEVEHIVPLSISLDNSFLNKTLCHRDANRQKANRTPWEAFGHDEKLWNEISARVKRFPGGTYNLKVQRFLSDERPDLDDFTRQQLTDTSYMAKESMGYLGLLYGEDAGSRVQAARGGVTAFLRAGWRLNGILGDGDVKTRDDHRHHAVDALVVALTDRRSMRMLSEAAVRSLKERGKDNRLHPFMEEPWKGFAAEAREKTLGVIVSRRVSRKVSGPLHEDTYYGKPKNGNGDWFHLRRPVTDLSEKDIASEDAIVDKAVRQAVREAFKRLPKSDPKLFELPEHTPYLTARDGRRRPIRKVRLRYKRSTTAIGEEGNRRYAVSGNNHHVEVLGLLDANGAVTGMTWETVPMLEAYRRKKHREPVVRRDHGPGRKFLFSIGAGENATLLTDTGERALYVCRGTGKDALSFSENNDARMQKVLRAAKARIIIQSEGALFQRRVAKVVVSTLGEIRDAHD